MKVRFYMPTRVVAGPGCVAANAELLGKYGKRALIMTGRSSAKKNGSGKDVEQALFSQGVSFSLFDGVETNLDIRNCRAAADAACAFGADFIVGIGGGSALDAAKAAAILARDGLSDDRLFSGPYPRGTLPVVAVPTTAGTGSEVTQYAILTNDAIESKSSIAWDGAFPVLAFLDAAYTASLPRRIAVNTALDALSHAVEGYVAVKADPWSRALAAEALRTFGECLPRLADGVSDVGLRSELLLASNMAGAVIAQTATTIVHAMGYSLTYFKDIDHGRANGLLLAAYLEFLAEARPEAVREILSALGCRDVAGLARLLDSLLGERENIRPDEARKFALIALKTKHVANTPRAVGEADIVDLYTKSLKGRKA